MRLIWNAGAAIGVTLLLTAVAVIVSSPRHAAQAATTPFMLATVVADMPHRHYSGLPEHFQAANSTHDGRLTQAQATQAGWTRVARHFDEIDSAHLGFVTEAQVHAYNAAHRRGHKPAAET